MTRHHYEAALALRCLLRDYVGRVAFADHSLDTFSVGDPGRYTGEVGLCLIALGLNHPTGQVKVRGRSSGRLQHAGNLTKPATDRLNGPDEDEVGAELGLQLQSCREGRLRPLRAIERQENSGKHLPFYSPREGCGRPPEMLWPLLPVNNRRGSFGHVV